MLKKSSLFLTFLLLQACGPKQDSGKSNNNENGDELVQTSYVKASELACNYQDGTPKFTPLDLNSEIVGGVLTTEFDIIFPKNLSAEVIADLKAKANKGEKISSENFWTNLGPQTQVALNDYLIQNFGTLRDRDFDIKRRLTAYAFSSFIEIEDYQQAISIEATSSKLFKKFTVAFSYDIRKRIELNYCHDQNLGKISLPKGLLIPSDIVTNIFCKDFYEDSKVSFQIQKDQKLYINLEYNGERHLVEIETKDIKTNDSIYAKDFSYKNDQYDISVKVVKKRTRNAYYDVQSRSFIYDTIKFLNIDFEEIGKERIKLERLDCRSVKPFII